MLYVLAVTSIGVYGLVLAGWASGSTYPLLGGLRSSAQVISYEIAMGLSFVAVFLYSGSMSTSEIVTAQDRLWFAIILLPSFLIYVISMVGETNRAPFDLPEAEGELVGGFHTEYSSLKFALFFLAEYINMFTVAALATTLFLGGWQAPWPLGGPIWDGANDGWWPVLWFVGKLWVFMFMFIWLRGSLPRMRYDQFMKFGWKLLIPLSLLWIAVVATVRAISNEAAIDRQDILVWGGALLAVLLVVSLAWDFIAGRSAGDAVEEPQPFDPFVGRAPCATAAGAAATDGRGRGLEPMRTRRCSMPSFLDPIAGFGVTFATMFRKVTTEEYPEQRKPMMPRFHGRHVLNRYSDGLERCIGCELCAWACPADAIYVEGASQHRR